MRVFAGLSIGFLAAMFGSQRSPDESAVRDIIQAEVAAWDKGDAVAYSHPFAPDGTFTNIAGQFFAG